ncbi:MAG: transcription termination/antitermination protein NusG [Sandaracinus sp.]|nr:transcription termination/antitermination protein NusG [Sandaracinus sp.]MBJ70609.1 transcription termination/antitermination protein NusG [Sandaracinus sp.]
MENEAQEETVETSGEEQAPASNVKPGMDWYVIQAYSGYENKVKLSLEERIRQAGMEDLFGEILIPKESVQENRGGKKRVVNRNFYPGYIFLQMNLTDETWHLVKGTPKVSGFIGGRHPSPVPKREIEVIARQVAQGSAKPTPRVSFEPGDHVRVTEGAFANYTGTIEEVNAEKHKVRVLISIFGRATPVELEYGQVEKTV